MVIKEYNELLNIDESIFNGYGMMDVSYFDIETTGFDKEEDSIILISLGRFINNESFSIKQYFGESLEDEKQVLYSFAKDFNGTSKWCSYNGMAFDEPFIKRRMEKYGIHFESPQSHVDLYRLVRPYYKQLGMERCNLKSVERHIGIQREDQIDGGISVDMYKEFLMTSKQGLKDTIMLHNYEDVLNLPKIHEYIYNVENNNKLIREDGITEKQLKYLNSLLEKSSISLDVDLDRISKRAASRIIDYILKGYIDCKEITNIISNSY